jgi:hypothetical protein
MSDIGSDRAAARWSAGLSPGSACPEWNFLFFHRGKSRENAMVGTIRESRTKEITGLIRRPKAASRRDAATQNPVALNNPPRAVSRDAVIHNGIATKQGIARFRPAIQPNGRVDKITDTIGITIR